MKDKYGVVHDEQRNEFEKKWQLQAAYDFISFDFKEARDNCRSAGEGYVVEKISTSGEREIIFKA